MVELTMRGADYGMCNINFGMRNSYFRLRLRSLAALCMLYTALSVSLLVAQDIRATAKVDSNNIMIGDWLGLHIEVQHKDHTTVTWPSIADSLEGFEIVKRGNIETKKNGNDVLETITYTVTAFDSGSLVFPPLQFLYTNAGDTTKKSSETSPIPVFVHTIAVDTSLEIKDVKPPLTLSISFMELLPYIITFIVLVGIGWLLFYIWKKKKLGESILPEAPPRPAHEVALESLRALESESLWQRGKTKEFYSQLTDIVRTYIEGRFDVKAMEMVTDEIMSSAPIASMNKESREPLQNLLILADFVKFAKVQPTQQDNETSLPIALKFVETTWRKPQQRPEEPQAQQPAAEQQKPEAELKKA